ncbi:ATP-binding cassette domain-containing protein [Gallaecimonas xiamenensis]|uniref:ABC transporter ATP-binding protein n=1 Tax=Gallaecimonas xiamenensis 3-C-1 TaxID=745411 RepID=K2IZK4_9GAMM|nr:ATP-binding cassette domain-containing protein [Gallaecimonas xiamenensis]EKE75996.1 ABC transporter ATP-binding protein [Gallaecimonas xiamenensis 3-C-1]
MTTPFLTLENVSYVLPDGRTLFSQLNAQMDLQRSALVGRNGVGKSVLAQLLAGLRQPSSGQCNRGGTLYYLPQQLLVTPGLTLAGLLGVEQRLQALARIEAGSLDQADFDILGNDWTLPGRLQSLLAQRGLGHLSPAMAAAEVSGGEAMQVALAGAVLAGADCLILDEPTNHLDSRARQQLLNQLEQWQGALLVVSHDRQLLAAMERIYELSPLGLRSYGGNYQDYQRHKEEERAQVNQQLQQLKHQRRKEQQQLQAQKERMHRRQATAAKADQNQAKILLGRQKQGSQKTMGKLQLHQQQRREKLEGDIAEAGRRVEQVQQIHLHLGTQPQATGRTVLKLDQIVLLQGPQLGPLNLTLAKGQRLAVVGDNGSGKSSLLQVMAGTLPASGNRHLNGRLGYLDQQASLLDPGQSLLAQLPASQGKDQGQLRTWLAHMGFDAPRLAVACADLSGGERIKAALALLLLNAEPPDLLILDEPSNHLDLPSLQALESLLSRYQGALVVVSHDQDFLQQLKPSHRLRLSPPAWHLAPW